MIKDFLEMEKKREGNERNFLKEVFQSFMAILGVIAIGVTLLFQRNDKKGDELDCEDG